MLCTLGQANINTSGVGFWLRSPNSNNTNNVYNVNSDGNFNNNNANNSSNYRVRADFPAKPVQSVQSMLTLSCSRGKGVCPILLGKLAGVENMPGGRKDD